MVITLSVHLRAFLHALAVACVGLKKKGDDDEEGKKNIVAKGGEHDEEEKSDEAVSGGEAADEKAESKPTEKESEENVPGDGEEKQSKESAVLNRNQLLRFLQNF